MGGRDKGNISFTGGDFCEAKNEIRRRRKRGRAKISSPQPPSFLPARASGERSEPISRDFVQKRFALRSAIATSSLSLTFL